MKNLISWRRLRSSLPRSRKNARFGRKELDSEKGQALLETVMSVGFLVAIAIAMNKMLRPIVVEAFEKIASALSAVGP
ncbi:MAG: hypothetical protein BMS9Abin37_1997 [Acidobacteriota bacterium]|nr:MAG: hypothetical protein BMS9Abin37_1997 [Acidobacteriota bacterium]